MVTHCHCDAGVTQDLPTLQSCEGDLQCNSALNRISKRVNEFVGEFSDLADI